MKKLLFTLVIVCAGVLATQAQSFQLGVKGALNFSKLKSDDGVFLSSSNKMGYQVGLWSRIGGLIHLQPELYVTGKSSEATVDVNGDRLTTDVTFTNIDLPILVGTRIGVDGIGIRFQAGPSFSFVVDKNIGETLGDVVKLENYKKSNMQIVGGVGIDIGKLRGDVRYETSLNSLTKSNNDEQKMGVFSVGIGLRLF